MKFRRVVHFGRTYDGESVQHGQRRIFYSGRTYDDDDDESVQHGQRRFLFMGTRETDGIPDNFPGRSQFNSFCTGKRDPPHTHKCPLPTQTRSTIPI
jgi:hypothetical protein